MEEDFPSRVFFDELNSDSLNIKCFYWFHPPDYWQYMEFTQKVNQEIITNLIVRVFTLHFLRRPFIWPKILQPINCLCLKMAHLLTWQLII